MKKDNLLNAFKQKGITNQKGKLQSISKEKAITPIDSGMLINIKGGQLRPIRNN